MPATLPGVPDPFPQLPHLPFSRPPGQPPAYNELRPAHPVTTSPRRPPHSREVEGHPGVPP